MSAKTVEPLRGLVYQRKGSARLAIWPVNQLADQIRKQSG